MGHMAGMVQDAHSATLKSSFMSIQACTLARALLYSNSYLNLSETETESEQLASRKRVRSRPQAGPIPPAGVLFDPPVPNETVRKVITTPHICTRARTTLNDDPGNPPGAHSAAQGGGVVTKARTPCGLNLRNVSLAVGCRLLGTQERAFGSEQVSWSGSPPPPDARHWLESQSFTPAENGCIESALTDSQELTPQEWLKTLRGPYC